MAIMVMVVLIIILSRHKLRQAAVTLSAVTPAGVRFESYAKDLGGRSWGLSSWDASVTLWIYEPNVLIGAEAITRE